MDKPLKDEIPTTMGSPALYGQKTELRTSMRERRTTFQDTIQSNQQINERVLASEVIVSSMIIAGYHAIRNECDPADALLHLRRRGHTIGLPRIDNERRCLHFHLYEENDPLIPGLFGILEPRPEAPLIHPNFFLVPLLAFDRLGHRLGYGGGFYDRTLRRVKSTRPMLTMGLAFSFQEATVPVHEHDIALDIIITERETIRADVG